MSKSKALLLWLIAFGGICSVLASQKTDLRQRTLKFPELNSLGLLPKTKDPVALAKGYWRTVYGVQVDSESKNLHVMVVSGTENLEGKPHGEYEAIDVGYIRVFGLERGRYKEIFWKEFDDYHGYTDQIEVHNVKPSGIPVALVHFEVPGSTYIATFNEIVILDPQKMSFIEVESDYGPIQIKDVDGDGLEEILVHRTANPGDPGPMRLQWYDVCEIDGNKLKNVSEQYPRFYKNLIATYYEPAIKDYHSDEPYYMEKFAEFVQTLIERAKKLAQIR